MSGDSLALLFSFDSKLPLPVSDASTMAKVLVQEHDPPLDPHCRRVVFHHAECLHTNRLKLNGREARGHSEHRGREGDSSLVFTLGPWLTTFSQGSGELALQYVPNIICDTNADCHL